MIEIGSTIVREEAEFIPARMKKVQHIEHAYECKSCKSDVSQSAQIKRGKAPPFLGFLNVHKRKKICIYKYKS